VKLFAATLLGVGALLLAAVPFASAATLEECTDACNRIPQEVCMQKWLRIPECTSQVSTCLQACNIPDFVGVEPSACAFQCDALIDECYSGKWTIEQCTQNIFACMRDCATFVTAKFKTFEVRVGGAAMMDATGAVAKDFSGRFRKVAAERVVLERRGEAAGQPFVLELPVELPPGEKLESFEVPGTGLRWSASADAGEMRLPLKSEGAEIAEIRAKTGAAVGTGTSARIPVENLALQTRPIESDLSKSAPSLGKVAAELKADLSGLPDNATLKLRGESVVGAEAREELRKRAAQDGLRLKEAPYALAAEKQGLDPTIQSAQVTLKVGEAWAKQNGPENVKIFRKSDAGQTEILDTKFQGYEGGQGVFTANSSGFSVFSLVAVEGSAAGATPAATGATPSPAPRKSPGLEAALALTALVAAGFAFRRPR
jgi:hypothetical protein